jgi:Protein of unknown function (DUF2927)
VNALPAGLRVRCPPARRAVIAALLVVAGCAVPPTTQPPAPPQASAPEGPVSYSAASLALRRYYLGLQEDLLARGLLRTDGGGPDTPFSPDDLARNFEAIAFFDEYGRNTVGTTGRLQRWDSPVRLGVAFGPKVEAERRKSDLAVIRSYTRRLARITGHPISMVRGSPQREANFNVIVAGEDDREFVETRLRQLVPGIGPRDLALFSNPPKSVYCLVVAFSSGGEASTYNRAVALIRDEHPDLVRRACIHEEIAQGLGLANDSPDARPSIFNDDDEFALLTNHDELLLKMLYDPRLKPGMTAAQARPVTRIIARDLMGREL